MIRKFVRLLPYCVVVRLVGSVAPRHFKLDGFDVVGWEIDDNEWIVRRIAE